MKNLINGRYYAIEVTMKIAAGVHLCRIEEWKVLEGIWKLFRPGHGSVAHENRNRWKAPAQRGFHLDANRIGSVHNSTAAALRSEPFLSDNDQYCIGVCQLFLNVNAEVLAERDIVDIYKS